MKLLYRKLKYIRYQKRVARRAAKRRVLIKNRDSSFRRSVVKKSKKTVTEWRKRRRYRLWIKAPSSLAFLADPDSVAGFINKIEDGLSKKPSLFIDMVNVEKIDYATITALLAVLYRAKRRGKKINGSKPNNEIARQLFDSSGFLYTLFSDRPDAGHKYDINEDSQLFTLDRPELTVVSEIEKSVSMTVLNKEKKLAGLYTTLGELMDNTATHASDEEGKTERWWISINHNKKDNLVEFVFIDYGIGIFTSLNSKNAGHPVKNLYQKAQQAFGVEATEAHLRSIVTESARKTYKLTRGRGEGIYSIYQATQRHEIGNLHIISNNAFGAVETDQYKRLRNSLNGTLYYWDVCVKNYA